MNRVATIRSLIASGAWSPTRDILRLSEEWGISEQEVFGYAVEAHQRAGATRMAEQEEITGALARMRASYDLALAAKKEYVVCGELITVDHPDIKGMLAAEELYLRTIGVLSAKKKAELGEGADAKMLLLSEMTSNPEFARLIAGSLTHDETQDTLRVVQALPVPSRS